MNNTVPVLLSRDAAEKMHPDRGRLSALLLKYGSMELRWYAPRDGDPQTPHYQDEIYVVAAGRGWFECGDQRVAFRTGDALFAPARTPHRFDNYTPDLAVWVIFYRPKGGDAT